MPLRKFGEPDDLKGLAAYLASMQWSYDRPGAGDLRRLKYVELGESTVILGGISLQSVEISLEF